MIILLKLVARMKSLLSHAGEAGRRKVFFGRALAGQPEVLLCDEPLSAVDEGTRGDLADLLARTHRETGLTVLHVTHSAWEAERLGDPVLRMEGGRVVPA